MFEVIISAIRTGKVERKRFGTREEADGYVEHFMSRRFGKARRSVRDYRVEVNYREAPAVHPVLPAADVPSAPAA
jgi:hypothetical protein